MATVQNSLASLGEFGFIKQISRMFPVPSGIVGIGDDCAVFGWEPGKKVLWTTDMLICGVHFTLKMPPKAIGRKALASSISDVAAMGGVARYAVISLGVPASASVKVLSSVYQGIKALAKEYDILIVGGDTVRSKELVINIALLGQAAEKNIIYRNQARPGDQIFVSGPLGNSFKSGHHLYFTPRVKESQYLVKHAKPSAMIDISDGLAADLGHIVEKSRVGAVLFKSQIPRREKATFTQALFDGEDFELLFTVNKDNARKLLKTKSPRFFHVGEITLQKGLRLKDTQGRISPLKAKGYRHF